MTFLQGNTYSLEIKLKQNGENLNLELVSKIQFIIGNIEKIYDGENGIVSYDTENECFIVPLTQEETYSLREYENWQARVLYQDGSVDGTAPSQFETIKSLTRKVLANEEE